MHFARSDVLARRASVPSVWWHSTDHPTLILGAGQRWERDPGDEVAVVRRQAGGTAVFAAAGVLGQDVFLPAGHRLADPDIVEAYRWLGETWASALARLGIPARVVSIAEARAAAGRELPEVVRLACFGTLSPYEVVLGNRKIVGLAQVRRRGNVLLQAGVHLDFDAESLARSLGWEEPESAAMLREAAVGVREVQADVGEDEIVVSFEQALQERMGVELENGEWTDGEIEGF